MLGSGERHLRPWKRGLQLMSKGAMAGKRAQFGEYIPISCDPVLPLKQDSKPPSSCWTATPEAFWAGTHSIRSPLWPHDWHHSLNGFLKFLQGVPDPWELILPQPLRFLLPLSLFHSVGPELTFLLRPRVLLSYIPVCGMWGLTWIRSFKKTP